MDYFGGMTWDPEAVLFTPWEWLLLNGIPTVRKETWHHRGAAAPEVKELPEAPVFKGALWPSSWLKDKKNTRILGQIQINAKFMSFFNDILFSESVTPFSIKLYLTYNII